MQELNGHYSKEVDSIYPIYLQGSEPSAMCRGPKKAYIVLRRVEIRRIVI
jgi:hypothetical protein